MDNIRLLIISLFTISITSCSVTIDSSVDGSYKPLCDTNGMMKVSPDEYLHVGMSIPEFACVARRYNRNPLFNFSWSRECIGAYFCFEKGNKTYFARSVDNESIAELKVVDTTKITYEELMADYPLSEWKKNKVSYGSYLFHNIATTNLDGVLKFGSPTASLCYLKKMYENDTRANSYAVIPVYRNDAVCGVLSLSPGITSSDDGTMYYYDDAYSIEPAIIGETMVDGERNMFWMPPLELDESYSQEDCYSDAKNPVDTDVEREAYEAVSTGNLTKLSSFGINPYYKDKLYATVGDCSIVGTMEQHKDDKTYYKYRCEVSNVQVQKRTFLRKHDFDSYRDGMKREELLSDLGYPNANWPEDLDGFPESGFIADSVCGGYDQRVFAYPVYSDCVEKPTNEDIVAIAVIHFQEKEGKEYVSSGIEFHDSFYEWNLPRY